MTWLYDRGQVLECIETGDTYTVIGGMPTPYGNLYDLRSHNPNSPIKVIQSFEFQVSALMRPKEETEKVGGEG